jgi:RNA polymerase sporulation-specific sigma factor
MSGYCKCSQDTILNLSEEDLAEKAQSGDADAQEILLERYGLAVRKKARIYYLVGADRDDIIQEGMIGLFKAIRDFNRDRQASFKSFANICINRQIITAVKMANRQKHLPLNLYVSFDGSILDDSADHTMIDVVSQKPDSDPEAMFITAENLLNIQTVINSKLSGFERQVLKLYIEDKSYREISSLLGKPVKSVDNAIQRIRKKLWFCLSNENE